LVNSCSSAELVRLSGEVVFETKTHTAANGTTHIGEVLTITGAGVGDTSGASYTLNDVTHTKIKIGDPFPYSFRERRVSNLIGNGVPDQLLTFDTVLTFDADGNVKHDIFKATLICSP
jgi:hypothetical protein